MAQPGSTFSVSSPPSMDRDFSPDAASSSSSLVSSPSSSSQACEQDGYRRFDHQHHANDGYDHDDQLLTPSLAYRPIGVSYGENLSALGLASEQSTDDSWSCVTVVLTFWFFVSMFLMMGVYGSVNLRLAPNSSILIQPNPLFVESLEVKELDDAKPGLVLYGFYKPPPLDVVSTWSETHRLSIPADSHKEWLQYLNEGSLINISYRVKSANSSIVIVIARGDDGLAQWLQDPKYPSTGLLWNIIYGNGVIQQDIYTSSTYYVAVGNLNSKEVEVKLNITIRAILYNTSKAYYKCTFINGHCGLGVLLPEGNSVVLASSAPEKNMSSEWYIRLSYGPRWSSYIIGIGGLTILVLVAFHLIKQFQPNREDEAVAQRGEVGPERAPLLSNKDDDIRSQGSSYDCASNDDDDLDNHLVVGSIEGKLVQDGENGNNIQRLCAICFDAPRDCFFLPCGHCVACFKCGTRIAEVAGTCPICRRNMKKVRKIFTV